MESVYFEIAGRTEKPAAGRYGVIDRWPWGHPERRGRGSICL